MIKLFHFLNLLHLGGDGEVEMCSMCHIGKGGEQEVSAAWRIKAGQEERRLGMGSSPAQL